MLAFLGAACGVEPEAPSSRPAGQVDGVASSEPAVVRRDSVAGMQVAGGVEREAPSSQPTGQVDGVATSVQDVVPQESVAATRLEDLPQVMWGERVLGPFSVAGKDVRVVLKLARLDASISGREMVTVAAFRIVDNDGRVHHEEEYQIELSERRFQNWYELKASVLELSAGTALMLDYYVYPSAPGSEHSRQLFAWKDGSLAPLSPHFGGWGHFQDLPEEAGPIAFRLLPGDRMPFEAWLLYFAVEVPLHIRLAAFSSGQADPLHLALEIDPASGLAVLPVSSPVAYWYGDEVQEVTLYRSPMGQEADRVQVTRTSEIVYGPAYGQVRFDRGPLGQYAWIDVEIARLRVTIDGKAGFVEEKDYGGVGLSIAG